jgi:hypothetical protein
MRLIVLTADMNIVEEIVNITEKPDNGMVYKKLGSYAL